jgi:hypothetical protein
MSAEIGRLAGWKKAFGIFRREIAPTHCPLATISPHFRNYRIYLSASQIRWYVVPRRSEKRDLCESRRRSYCRDARRLRTIGSQSRGKVTINTKQLDFIRNIEKLSATSARGLWCGRQISRMTNIIMIIDVSDLEMIAFQEKTLVKPLYHRLTCQKVRQKFKYNEKWRTGFSSAGHGLMEPDAWRDKRDVHPEWIHKITDGLPFSGRAPSHHSCYTSSGRPRSIRDRGPLDDSRPDTI